MESTNTQKSTAAAARPLSNAQVFHFFEQMHALMTAGITPFEALRVMHDNADNAALEPVLRSIAEQISTGARFSDALAGTGVFPSYVIELMNIGEWTGRVEEVCGALSRYYEEEDELRESVRSAVSYPVIMIGMMFIVVFVLLRQVLPVFMLVFRQLGASAGGMTQMLIGISDALSRYYLVFAVIMAAAVLLFLYFYHTRRGQQQFRRFAEHFPPTRRFTERLALMRFVNALQMMHAAGMDAYTSLDLSARIVENASVCRRIDACKALLMEGRSFSEAIGEAELFDPFYVSMIRVFSEAGSIDRALEFIAVHYKRETDQTIRRTLSAIEPTVVVILSLVVGMVLLSVILPLIGIMSGIG